MKRIASTSELIKRHNNGKVTEELDRTRGGRNMGGQSEGEGGHPGSGPDEARQV